MAWFLSHDTHAGILSEGFKCCRESVIWEVFCWSKIKCDLAGPFISVINPMNINQREGKSKSCDQTAASALVTPLAHWIFQKNTVTSFYLSTATSHWGNDAQPMSNSNNWAIRKSLLILAGHSAVKPTVLVMRLPSSPKNNKYLQMRHTLSK